VQVFYLSVVERPAIISGFSKAIGQITIFCRLLPLHWLPMLPFSGKLDVTVLYAGAHITDTAAANAANPGATNPIPAAFWGFYAQAAHSVWQNQTFRLTPFVRWEPITWALLMRTGEVG
jgi:hypothetical protein